MCIKLNKIVPQKEEILIGQITPIACSPHNPMN